MIRFDIDLMLPVQYRAPALPRGPEHRLMLAVFENALHDLHHPVTIRTGDYGARVRSRITHDAQLWFRTDDHAWPFSFLNCCAQLGLNPEAVRDRLGVTALATSLRLVGHRPSIVAPSTRRHRRRAG